MALPSAVTATISALVIAAGVGFVVSGPAASEAPVQDHTAATPKARTNGPVKRREVTTPRRHTGAPAEHKHAREGAPHGRAHTHSSMLVDVYNNAGITGLAADKTALLQGAGWDVAATGNWHGDIPSTTVYYPPEHRHDAKQLATRLRISRLHPAVAPMHLDRLTVIFTSS